MKVTCSPPLFVFKTQGVNEPQEHVLILLQKQLSALALALQRLGRASAAKQMNLLGKAQP